MKDLTGFIFFCFFAGACIALQLSTLYVLKDIRSINSEMRDTLNCIYFTDDADCY